MMEEGRRKVSGVSVSEVRRQKLDGRRQRSEVRRFWVVGSGPPPAKKRPV
jgi:hypothetical protein